MSDFSEALNRIALEVVSLKGSLNTDKVRVAAEVDGLLIQIAIGNWDCDEEEEK